MNENQRLANEVAAALNNLNDKLQAAENAGLCVAAKINEFKSLDAGNRNRTRIEADLLLPITPITEKGENNNAV